MFKPFTSQPVTGTARQKTYQCQLVSCYAYSSSIHQALRVICSSLITSILEWTGAQLAALALVYMYMLKQVLLSATHINLSRAAKVRSQLYSSQLNVILNMSGAICASSNSVYAHVRNLDETPKCPRPTAYSLICGAVMLSLSPLQYAHHTCIC